MNDAWLVIELNPMGPPLLPLYVFSGFMGAVVLVFIGCFFHQAIKDLKSK